MAGAYYDPFWYYGPDCVLASVFWPGPIYGPYYADWPYGYAGLYDIYGYGDDAGYGAGYGYGTALGYRSTIARDQQTNPPHPSKRVSNTNQAETCGGLAPGVTDLPVDRIGDAVHPTGDQIAALNDLKSAASRAADVLKASCPSEAAPDAGQRLDAMEKRFRAVG